MSEIPIGSPPAPPGRHAAPSGWYPDPAKAGQERYWDGWQWSRNTREVAVEAPSAPPGQPVPAPPYAPQQGYGQPYPAPGGPGPQGWQPAPTGKVTTTADGVPLAGWWYRVLTVVIDTVLVSVIASLVSLPILLDVSAALTGYFEELTRRAQQGITTPPDLPVSTGQQVLIGAATVGVGFVYYLVFWRFLRASPGQLLVGLRVVPVDQGRSTGRLDWSRSIIRSLLWTVPGFTTLLLIFQLLDVLFPLWQPKRQTLHDLAAGTQVVKIR